MIIYACKYKLKDRYEFYIGKDINYLLTPAFWNKDQLLEIMMFRVHDTYKLDITGNSETLETLCQEMAVLQP